MISGPDAVAAIVVTYHPEIKVLEQFLNVLSEQVDSIIVVDNGSGRYVREFLESRIWPNEFLISFETNRGVAAAQNAGIEWARHNGYSHVLLFDQDSIPAPDMVFHLQAAMRRLIGQGIQVAAVGPRYQDARNMKHPSFIKVDRLKVQKIGCMFPNEIVETDIIISSGSLIALSTLAEVGGPLNELFIDQVDMEWCFRAKSFGYSLFGVCDAVLHHSLGQAPKLFLGRRIVHQNPVRHYYIFRNAVWLLLKAYVPLRWKYLFIRTICVRFLFYGCFVSPRQAYLRMMMKGVRHGLKGRLGKIEIDRQSVDG